VPDMATDLAEPLATIPGRPVDPADVPPGCAYAARCPLADARCRAEDPPLTADPAGPGRRVACWHAGEPLPVRRDVDELVESFVSGACGANHSTQGDRERRHRACEGAS
jgi:peptide/nickel transport system permease protein